LLVASDEGLQHKMVRDLAELLPESALLVINDTRVRRARLIGERLPGRGRVELLMLEQLAEPHGESESWRALGHANKPLAVGTQIEAHGLSIEIVAKDSSDATLELRVQGSESVETILERSGHVPIPPYLARVDEPEDVERYQTLYARRVGSVAAPTAGLHLTPAIFSALRERGIRVAELELEVGLGTFRPVTAEDLDQHLMHSERFHVGEELALQIALARERGAKIVAVGTTVVRALESAADPERLGYVRSQKGTTRLLIQPGFRFRVVDSLFTNFHQPRSTLLALVAAFAGYELTLKAYAAALENDYRFLSYGDAMWIPRRQA
jgi:S-adenosylmethionine:tRNA ribosyltransferase-isomerase